MKTDFLNQTDLQPLNDAELTQIEGGLWGYYVPVHVAPPRFPKRPVRFPIIEPILVSLEP